MSADQGSIPIHLIEDAARILSHAVSEVVPPQAQKHLFNAQRELLLAVAITIEHNASRMSTAPVKAPHSRRSPRKGGAVADKNRPTKIDIS